MKVSQEENIGTNFEKSARWVGSLCGNLPADLCMDAGPCMRVALYTPQTHTREKQSQHPVAPCTGNTDCISHARLVFPLSPHLAGAGL